MGRRHPVGRLIFSKKFDAFHVKVAASQPLIARCASRQSQADDLGISLSIASIFRFRRIELATNVA
jgi:hypothetical protein